MTVDVDSLVASARSWIAEDPDPDTTSELESLLKLVDVPDPDPVARADLADRFAGTLEFGTAGLRGTMGAGPNRMNRIVVSRAAAGLVAYLKANGADAGASVVIGYDARHKSDVFATDTAEIVSGAGLTAMLLPRPLPTPVLAFAIRHLGAVAGVMVTASHNPPRDNGYKVYLGDGSQIVPPADTDISRAIADVGPMASIPRSNDWQRLDESVLSAYLAGVSSIVDTCGPKQVRSVYTPLHGVGGDTVQRAMRLAGFPAPLVATAQADPDPDFPTVSFPNPEEPGAMDLAMALAQEHGADVVVANDPDADRCAVAVPTVDGWRMLRGDEVGALLADFLLRQRVQGVYATTVVSSSLLGKMAAEHDQPYEETLTGFKWLGRIPGLAFGYEEALGYCVDPSRVKDKDGISALLKVVELTALLKADGLTLQDRLDEIARQYGLHATDQLSLRVRDLSVISRAMKEFRASPPSAIGGLDVLAVDDLSQGGSGLPPTDALRFRLAEHGRLVVRPSGTEPKLKCYFEAVLNAEDLGSARDAAAARLSAMKADVAERLED